MHGANWGVLGRTYVAHEGINAQISVPKANFGQFKQHLYAHDFLDGLRLNIAIEDDGKSFFKLVVKVRSKILADGLNDDTFDVTNSGVHINAEEFNQLTEKDDETVIVDMRNHYESEVGHFQNAITPDVESFRESLPIISELLQRHRNKNIVMYCTGGIRCEKASAYFKHQGFEKVYQLNGGIIEYARQVKTKGLENKFMGKNFVFDERLGERISEEIISECHQCGVPCDTHTNCANVGCNLLFIQCSDCAKKYENCCGNDCRDFIHLPEEEQQRLRREQAKRPRYFKKGRK